MNKVFFNDIYIHMITITLILSYSIITSLYILFSDNYNVGLRIFVIFVIKSIKITLDYGDITKNVIQI